MEKIRELYHDSLCDQSSLVFVNDILLQFPTQKGYRVEVFFSPKFVRVSVYRAETMDVNPIPTKLSCEDSVLKAIWRHINYYDGFHSMSDYGPSYISLSLRSDEYPEDFRIIREWIKKWLRPNMKPSKRMKWPSGSLMKVPTLKGLWR